MIEGRGFPGAGQVADIALFIGRQVIVVFAGGGLAVVTGAARLGHRTMIEVCGLPGAGHMAQIAFFDCRQVIAILACGGGPVMTT